MKPITRNELDTLVTPTFSKLEKIDSMMLTAVLVSSLDEKLLLQLSDNLYEFAQGYRGKLKDTNDVDSG